MTELGRVGGVLGVRNGSTWMDGTGKDPIGAKGDNGGSDTRGPGEQSEGLLGGRGGGWDTRGAEVIDKC